MTVVMLCWPVLIGCPAPKHNYLNAARGGSNRKYPPCVCPRAREVYREWRARDKERERTTPERDSELRSLRVNTGHRVTVPIDPPNLRGGNCQRPDNQRKVDGGFNTALTKGGFAARGRAKAVCVGCPVLAACDAWWRSAEQPAGRWGGVIAGLDVWERQGRAIRLNPSTLKAEEVEVHHAA